MACRAGEPGNFRQQMWRAPHRLSIRILHFKSTKIGLSKCFIRRRVLFVNKILSLNKIKTCLERLRAYFSRYLDGSYRRVLADATFSLTYRGENFPVECKKLPVFEKVSPLVGKVSPFFEKLPRWRLKVPRFPVELSRWRQKFPRFLKNFPVECEKLPVFEKISPLVEKVSPFERAC